MRSVDRDVDAAHAAQLHLERVGDIRAASDLVARQERHALHASNQNEPVPPKPRILRLPSHDVLT